MNTHIRGGLRPMGFVGHANSYPSIRLLGFCLAISISTISFKPFSIFISPKLAQAQQGTANVDPTSKKETEKGLGRSVAEKVEETLKEAQQTLVEGRKVQETVDRQVSMMRLFLQVLTLVFVIFGALGFLEQRRNRLLRREAERTLQHAQTAIDEADKASKKAAEESLQITEIRQATEQTWAEIETSLFSKLPSVEKDTIVGMPSAFTADEKVAFEDADALLVFCDQLKYVSDREKLARWIQARSATADRNTSAGV